MNKHASILHTDDAWDTGQLGRDEEFVAVSPDDINLALDDALALQLISIRLEKSLIEDLKNIAKLEGLGYQPLIRQVLKRFARCEMKRILRETVEAVDKQKLAGKEQNTAKPKDKTAKDKTAKDKTAKDKTAA